MTFSLAAVFLAPVLLGRSGPIYLLGAVALGVFFLLSALRFWRTRTTLQARRVMRASLMSSVGAATPRRQKVRRR